jgi:deoxyribonuclease-4
MIKFGPSGNSESFYAEGFSNSVESALWTKNRGLDCFEYSFGRGVNLKRPTAELIGKAFLEAGVEISVHAPYFINFANPDDEMAQKSYGYVLTSADACKAMGGKRIVFHPATQGKMTREDAVELTKKRLYNLRDLIYENGFNDLIFCPETMGKSAQIGTIEEITDFCLIDNIYVPCVDFGHVNAREGGSLKTVQDYKSRLAYMIDKLGMEKMQKLHIHFSKIEFGGKGEVRHLTFEDKIYGPDFEPLAVAIKDLGLNPYIVSESAGTQAEDAFFMKQCYNKLV